MKISTLNMFNAQAERLCANKDAISIIDNATKKEVSIHADYTTLRHEIMLYCIKHENEVNDIYNRYYNISMNLLVKIKQFSIIIDETVYKELYDNEMCYKVNKKYGKLGLYTIIINGKKLKCKLIDVCYDDHVTCNTVDLNNMERDFHTFKSTIKLTYKILEVDL